MRHEGPSLGQHVVKMATFVVLLLAPCPDGIM
jgi:hypothetical protein